LGRFEEHRQLYWCWVWRRGFQDENYIDEADKADAQKAFCNCRHCLARRTCENAFSVLWRHFRICFTPIAVDGHTAELIVFAACIVYNFLRDERSSSSSDEEPSCAVDRPRNMQPLPRRKGDADFEAHGVRDQFWKSSYSRAAQLAWQSAHVERVR
jgi:hypothetical protein